MKTFFTTIVYSIILSSQVNAEPCDLLKLSVQPGVSDLLSSGINCQKATGISLTPPPEVITKEMQVAVCKKCPDLIEAASKIEIPNCEITLGDSPVAGPNNTGTTLKGLYDQLVSNCEAEDTTTPKPTTTTPAPTKEGEIEDAKTPESAAASSTISSIIVPMIVVAFTTAFTN